MSEFKATFEELRAKCLKEERLFEDPEFPAEDKSIYLTQPVSKHISWKRPKDLCKKPQFIIDGATRFDLDQGSLGNCWFIAAAATLATKPQLMEKVVPMNQRFTENYAGIFRFNFWRYGDWKEVIIDDRLPAKYGKTLEFCHNNEEPDEFWSALLEKAYAKLNGSYEALLGGNIQDALVDLTGGVSEMVDLTDKSQANDDLYQTMEKLDAANTLMGCCISVLGKSGSSPYENGLLSGHAYSISSLTTVKTSGGGKQIRLIRLLNPWGKAEWTGPWSDSSSEWEGISEEAKTQIQLKALEDGEFWMSFDDWRGIFTQLQLCHLTNNYFKDTAKLDWLLQSTHGTWVKGVNAGGCGCSPNEKFYWNNPQYCIVVDTSDSTAPSSPLIVSLMQKEKREVTTTSGGSNNITIGFRLFRLRRDEPISLDNSIFPSQTITLEKGIYEKFREVAHHYDDITSGIYCVIPTTYSPNEEAAFFLRVLTQQKASLIDLSKERDLKGRFAGVSMSRSRGTSRTIGLAGINMAPENLQEVTEPYISSVEVRSLGHSMSWAQPPLPPASHSPPTRPPVLRSAGVDAVDQGPSEFGEALTPADRDILEVYEIHVARNQSIGPGFGLLRRILTSLNDIGQLGGYRIHFKETECKILFHLVSSWRERRQLRFEQVRKIVSIIKQWVKTFSVYDRDFAEFIPFSEVWKALSSLGFELDDGAKEAVTISYARNSEGLFIADFINCVAKIQATDVYWKTKTTIQQSCNISLQELLERVLLT